MFDAVDGLEAEHAELESRLGDPEVHADARLAKQLNQRYAELSRILAAKREYDELVADIGAARELAAEDPSFAAEAEALADRLQDTEEQLRRLLVPRDPTDDKDAILEVKSGEGGEESALFAGDLLRMYTRYAETQGWQVEILDATESDLGRLQVGHRSRSRPRARPSRAGRRSGCSSSRAACTGSSGCRSRSPRAGCTRAPPASWCCPRPSRWT